MSSSRRVLSARGRAGLLGLCATACAIPDFRLVDSFGDGSAGTGTASGSGGGGQANVAGTQDSGASGAPAPEGGEAGTGSAAGRDGEGGTAGTPNKGGAGGVAGTTAIAGGAGMAGSGGSAPLIGCMLPGQGCDAGFKCIANGRCVSSDGPCAMYEKEALFCEDFDIAPLSSARWAPANNGTVQAVDAHDGPKGIVLGSNNSIEANLAKFKPADFPVMVSFWFRSASANPGTLISFNSADDKYTYTFGTTSKGFAWFYSGKPGVTQPPLGGPEYVKDAWWCITVDMQGPTTFQTQMYYSPNSAGTIINLLNTNGWEAGAPAFAGPPRLGPPSAAVSIDSFMVSKVWSICPG